MCAARNATQAFEAPLAARNTSKVDIQQELEPFTDCQLHRDLCSADPGLRGSAPVQGLGSCDQICTGIGQACLLSPGTLALNGGLIAGSALQLCITLVLRDDLHAISG